MASSFNGTNAFLGAFAPLTAYPFTLACWFNARDLTGAHGLICFGNPTVDTNHYVALRAAGEVAGDPIRYIIADGGGFMGVNTTTGYQAGDWQHTACVSASATSHAVFLNGGGKAVSASSVVFPTVSKMSIGSFDRLTNLSFCNGAIALPALWNAALTDAEIAALAAGAPPWLVRPDALVEYWSFDTFEARSAAGARRSLPLTAAGAPVAWSSDPPVLQAASPSLLQLDQIAARPPRHALGWLERLADRSAPRHDSDWIGRVARLAADAFGKPKRWYPGLGPSRRRP